MKVRIRFAKYGALKFIGHLDVMRYFQKAIRRADLPIAYSEGFSPHQIMSFAAPLSVGHTSEGEYLHAPFTGASGRCGFHFSANRGLKRGSCSVIPCSAGAFSRIRQG